MELGHKSERTNDFVQLREKLHHISERHLRSLWAEKGGMWQALNNQYRGEIYFSRFRPDIQLMNLAGSASEKFKYFILAFFESHIRHLRRDDLLSVVIDKLDQLIQICVKGQVPDELNSAQAEHLKQLYSRMVQENVKATTIKVDCIRSLLNQMTDIQWEALIATLSRENPDLFAQYDHERIRYLTTRSAIELPTDEYPAYAYAQLAKLYNREVDDFSLFNGAYGPANSALDENDSNFSGHRTPYHVNNGVIKEVRLQFTEPREVNPSSENHRWDAFVTLTSETTSYHKAIAPGKAIDPFQSIDDVIEALENLSRPLIFLGAKEDCQGIIKEIKALYNESYDAIYQYLYFSKPAVSEKRKDHQQSVADFLGIVLSPQESDQQAFLRAVEEKTSVYTSLPIYKQQFAKIIGAFATGKINHIGFQAELKLLATSYRPKSAWSRFKQYCWALVRPNIGAFSALREQYLDIDYLNSQIRMGYKDECMQMDKNIAQSAVNATLKVTVPQIRRQEKASLFDLYWLNEQEKIRMGEFVTEKLNQQELQQPSEKKVPQVVAQQSNPIYARAFSKLDFFASAPSKDDAMRLTKRVTHTINAHEKIIEAPKAELATVPTTSKLTQAQLTRAIFQGRQWERKALVSTYLLDTMDKENQFSASAQAPRVF